jgi:methyl-accepting chemotaxis protein
MDLDHANMAHAQWKVKLRSAISAKEAMDTATISKDNKCEFGQWLHGDAKAKFGHLSSYGKCVAAHAAFHIEAGKVATLINAKRYDDAAAMLGMGTPFAESSGNVTTAIFAMQKQVHEQTGVFLGSAAPAATAAPRPSA